jgi:hypothetical protein
MLGSVALERTDFSEEFSASFIRVTRIDELGTTLALIGNRPLFVFLVKDVLRSSETSVLTRVTRRNIPEDAILLYHKSNPSRQVRSQKTGPTYLLLLHHYWHSPMKWNPCSQDKCLLLLAESHKFSDDVNSFPVSFMTSYKTVKFLFTARVTGSIGLRYALLSLLLKFAWNTEL